MPWVFVFSFSFISIYFFHFPCDFFLCPLVTWKCDNTIFYTCPYIYFYWGHFVSLRLKSHRYVNFPIFLLLDFWLNCWLDIICDLTYLKWELSHMHLRRMCMLLLDWVFCLLDIVSCVKSSVSLLIFCPIVLFIIENGILKSPTVII